MFTGIVQGKGQVLQVERTGQDRRLVISAPAELLDKARTGDSFSVSGVCLTLLDAAPDRIIVDVSMETLSRTTLGALSKGDRVNLEPALRLADRLGGHLVSGHVDGVVELLGREPLGRAERFLFGLPAALARYVAVKGSVCLDGVSLTVNGVTETGFEVCVIPHTLSVTTLGDLRPGQGANIEVDLVARYLERMHGVMPAES